MYTKDNAKTYSGTKTLEAWPATLGEYNVYRGWTLPAGEDATEAGYIVEYEADGRPNHPNHEGYISWSPAGVFEKTYFLDNPEDVDNTGDLDLEDPDEEDESDYEEDDEIVDDDDSLDEDVK